VRLHDNVFGRIGNRQTLAGEVAELAKRELVQKPINRARWVLILALSMFVFGNGLTMCALVMRFLWWVAPSLFADSESAARPGLSATFIAGVAGTQLLTALFFVTIWRGDRNGQLLGMRRAVWLALIPAVYAAGSLCPVLVFFN
jgi:hypothetical protein